MRDEQASSWLTLAVGGIGIRLLVNDSALADALRHRYRDFPAEGMIHMAVKVIYHPPQGQALTSLAASREAGIEFQGGILRFIQPGFDGYVDEAAGVAYLEFSSPYPQEEIEYFIRVIVALLAYQSNGIMFHAAGIARRGRAYLFFGHSGSGKTTVSRLSQNDKVLNDDLVLLMPGALGWVAYATPFWNPTQVQPSPCSAPVTGLYRLVQDRQVYLEPMGSGQALAELVSNVPVIPVDAARSLGLLAIGRRLLAQVPAYRLHFLPDDSFWQVVDPSGMA